MTLKSLKTLLPFIMAAFTPVLTSHALAEVIESSKITPYKITGGTVEEVREQITLKGPKDGDTPRISHINAKVGWRFRTQMVGSKCVITEVKVMISIVRTVPELISNNKELKSQFARFRKRIDAHHEGHANNARSMARQMDRGIAALPRATTCDELKRSVERLGNRLGEETAAANREYAARTEYGRALGATWPP